MKFSVSEKNKLPGLPGVYKFYSRSNSLLYVGKAKNLKKRVSSYFLKTVKNLKTDQMVGQINYIDVIPVASEFEALLLEAKLINGTQPKYNVIWKDDKHYIYIKITQEKFPKVLFARKIDDDGYFYGPFPSAGIVREILAFLRRIFPYCTQKANAKRACFYHHLGLCDPCPAEINKLKGKKYQRFLYKYKQNVRSIRKILDGKSKLIEKQLTSSMESASRNQGYEGAAICRDRLHKLRYLINQFAPAESYIRNPEYLNVQRSKEKEELFHVLKPFYPTLSPIDVIECYDISNISGKMATGSMVTFRHGDPDKNLYRKFRIKLKSTADDFAMLSEVMTRRLSHKEWLLPDLFVIDGGKPQLESLKKIFSSQKIGIPFIGLAKMYEEIVVPKGDHYQKIKLADNSDALNLVKRLRDEAHRFAHSYHSLLRLKYLLSAVEKN